MAGRTRDWLKFGALVTLAFVAGLAFTSALDLPTRGTAAELAPAAPLQGAAPRVLPTATASVADLGNAFANVAEHVKPAVVFIHSERREQGDSRRLPPGFDEFFQIPRRPRVEQGTGSGFIVSPDGYILTNSHVVRGATRVTVRLLDNREYSAKIIGTDLDTDVAVVRIDAQSLPSITFGNSDSTRIGEWVLAIGNPLGENFTFTVTAGIVSAKGRGLQGLQQSRYAIQDFIQTDAAINPGNSGGPLLNTRGQVIGINSAIASETGLYAGYGFAIPINLVRVVMKQLIETGHVERAVMGIHIRDANQEDAEAVGLKEIRGILVKDFSGDDSPARRAGIQQGDVIVAVDNQRVDYVAQLQQRIAFKKPGETVTVTVLRADGVRRDIPVRLAPVPPADAQVGSVTERTPDTRGARPAAARDNVLGITVQALGQQDISGDPALREALRQEGGVAVTQVSPDGPAYRKLVSTADGVAAPDIIVKIDDNATRTHAEFRAALRDIKPGDIVTLTLVRRAQDGWVGDVVRIKAR